MLVLIRGNLSVSTRSCRDLHTLVWRAAHARVEHSTRPCGGKDASAKLTDKLLFSQAVFVRIRFFMIVKMSGCGKNSHTE